MKTAVGILGLFAVIAAACGTGQGPSLDEMLELPVVADGCPVGEEIARRTVNRSPIATASVELTCGTSARAADILKRVETLVGPFEGKTPMVGPVSLGVVSGLDGGVSRPSGWSPQFAFWQPGEFTIETRVLSGSEIPAEGAGWATVYEVTVRANTFAK